MVERLHVLRSIDAALLALVAVAAGFALYFFQQADDAHDGRAESDRRLEMVQLDFADLRAGSGKTALSAELEQLRAAPPSATLPSRREVLDVGSALTSYAVERQLLLAVFDTAETSATVGDMVYPALSYSIVVEGQPAALVEALRLASGLASTFVQNLEFERSAEDGEQWVMRLSLLVLHGTGTGLTEGGGGEAAEQG